MTVLTVQINQAGDFSLPAEVRQQYKLQTGDTFYLVDVDGLFILSPKKPHVPALSTDIEQARLDAGLSMADLLQSLQEERTQYFTEKYGD